MLEKLFGLEESTKRIRDKLAAFRVKEGPPLKKGGFRVGFSLGKLKRVRKHADPPTSGCEVDELACQG